MRQQTLLDAIWDRHISRKFVFGSAFHKMHKAGDKKKGHIPFEKFLVRSYLVLAICAFVRLETIRTEKNNNNKDSQCQHVIKDISQ